MQVQFYVMENSIRQESVDQNSLPGYTRLFFDVAAPTMLLQHALPQVSARTLISAIINKSSDEPLNHEDVSYFNMAERQVVEDDTEGSSQGLTTPPTLDWFSRREMLQEINRRGAAGLDFNHIPSSLRGFVLENTLTETLVSELEDNCTLPYCIRMYDGDEFTFFDDALSRAPISQLLDHLPLDILLDGISRYVLSSRQATGMLETIPTHFIARHLEGRGHRVNLQQEV